VFGREKLATILARVISEPQVNSVDVASKGPASSKAPVVATPETNRKVLIFKHNFHGIKFL